MAPDPALAYGRAMAFENVGPQWDRDEPWQVQSAKITIDGLTEDSPWKRHQRHVFFAALGGLALAIVIAIVVSLLLA
jgi:hypothetical protein